MTDLTSLPVGAPLWLTIFVVISGTLLTVSERVAKISGPLGAAARWWQNRAIRKVDQIDSLSARIDDAVRKQVGRKLAPLQEQIDLLKAELTAVRADLQREREEHSEAAEKLQREIDLRDEWIVLAHRFKRKTAIAAAEHDLTLPVDDLPNFNDWLDDRLSGDAT